MASRKIAIQQRILTQLEEVKQLVGPSDTPIERVMRTYDLQRQADALRDMRIRTMLDILASFGLEARTTP